MSSVAIEVIVLVEAFLLVFLLAGHEAFVCLCHGRVPIALFVELVAVRIALDAVVFLSGSCGLFLLAALQTILYPLDLTNDLRSVD